MSKFDRLIKEQMELLELPTKGVDKATLNKRRKTIAGNREIIATLNKGISREYIDKEITKLVEKQNSLESGYDNWLKNTPYMLIGDNPRITYEKKVGLPDIRRIVEFLNKLLNYI